MRVLSGLCSLLILLGRILPCIFWPLAALVFLGLCLHNSSLNFSLGHFPFFFFFAFLMPYLWHIEVPRLRFKSELQLPAYTTATAMPDLSSICKLHHSSQQCQILNPLSKARSQTHILKDTSQVRYC